MARPRHYILDGHIPVPVSFEEWMVWVEAADANGMRRVAETFTANGVRVSTVFLATDHNWIALMDGREGDPILFETMILGGLQDGYGRRYHSWDEAERGHEFAVALATNSTMSDVVALS